MTDPDCAKGIYLKYAVQRLGDKTGKHAKCRFFVLDPVHDTFARWALMEYVKRCEYEYPMLARDVEKLLYETAEAWARNEGQKK